MLFAKSVIFIFGSLSVKNIIWNTRHVGLLKTLDLLTMECSCTFNVNIECENYPYLGNTVATWQFIKFLKASFWLQYTSRILIYLDIMFNGKEVLCLSYTCTKKSFQNIWVFRRCAKEPQ